MNEADNVFHEEKAHPWKNTKSRHPDRNWNSDRISLVQHELLHHGPYLDTGILCLLPRNQAGCKGLA